MIPYMMHGTSTVSTAPGTRLQPMMLAHAAIMRLPVQSLHLNYVSTRASPHPLTCSP